MPLTESDKITLTKYPPLPSKCAICHKGSDGETEFVDFQLSFDYEGAVVICVACVAPVAQLLGYMEPKRVKYLEAQVKNLHDTAKEYQVENERLNNALDSILNVRPHLSPDYTVPDEDEFEASPGTIVLDFGNSSYEGTDDSESPESATE